MTAKALHITEHAKERAKERLNINANSLSRLAAKALEQGLKHSDAIGHLKKWCDGVYFRYGNANNMRIRGEHMFIFGSNSLITVYQVPKNLRKYIKISIEKRDK